MDKKKRDKTKIDWCTHTLNPVVGCTFNCTYCYAGRLNNRFKWVEDCRKANIPIFMKESLRELMRQDFTQEFPW